MWTSHSAVLGSSLQKIKNVTGVNSSRQKTLAIMKQNKTSVRQVSKLRDLTVSRCKRFKCHWCQQLKTKRCFQLWNKKLLLLTNKRKSCLRWAGLDKQMLLMLTVYKVCFLQVSRFREKNVPVFQKIFFLYQISWSQLALKVTWVTTHSLHLRHSSCQQLPVSN